MPSWLKRKQQQQHSKAEGSVQGLYLCTNVKYHDGQRKCQIARLDRVSSVLSSYLLNPNQLKNMTHTIRATRQGISFDHDPALMGSLDAPSPTTPVKLCQKQESDQAHFQRMLQESGFLNQLHDLQCAKFDTERRLLNLEKALLPIASKGA